MLQITYQDAEHGAVPLIKALTDAKLTGKGFGYYGPFYKGAFLAHVLNDSKCAFVAAYDTIRTSNATLMRVHEFLSSMLLRGQGCGSTLFCGQR